MSKFDSKLKAASAVVLSAALSGATSSAFADANPFGATRLESGYQLAQSDTAEAKRAGEQAQTKAKEGKCGEAKCGGEHAKAKEGKCGEAKCGGDKAKAKSKAKEGKCGEGKCGGAH